MPDYTIDFPSPPGTHGVSFQLTLQKTFENLANQYGLADSIPMIRVDYRDFIVNTVHHRAFSHIFLPVQVDWIDDILDREGFIRSFEGNMRRMLDTGEYFALLGVKEGRIVIERLPRDWVTQCAFYEKTGELLLLIYIEPVVLLTNISKISWRKTTWSPSSIKVEISTDEDKTEAAAYRVVSNVLNPFGFVPVVPFKLGTRDRGEPIWKNVEHLIGQIQDIVNDIRLINAYHAEPIKYVKTDGDFRGIGETGFVQIGQADELGVLTYSIGEGLFKELDYTVGIMSDISGIPITSILQVGRHASGEAIEKRLDTLTRTAKRLREDVGRQMQLMFRMMCAFISMGLVEVDLENPNIAPLLTEQVIGPTDSLERKEIAKAIYASNLGNAVDLTAYKVPDVKWVPVEKLNPQDLFQLIQGLNLAIEGGLMSEEEARRVLELNIDALVVAQDLVYEDKDESAASRLGGRLKMVSRESSTDTLPRVGITTLQ